MNTEERELWTNSRDKCFRNCQREHEYRYNRGYDPVSDRSSLLFGTLVHAGLEAWWLNLRSSTRLALSVEAFRAVMPRGYDPYEAAKIEALLIGYDTRWSNQEYETVAVEREFRVPLAVVGARSENFDRGGKIDAIARDPRGYLVGFEHKTSSLDIEPGSDYWKTLRIDGQSTTYFDGASQIGFDLREFVYDMIGKPRLKPLKATPVALRKYTQPTKKEPIPRLYANQRENDETVEEYFKRVSDDIAEHPEAYFQRVPIVRLAAEMQEHAEETFAVAEFAAEARRAGFAPKNTSACRRYGSLCDFLPVCAGEASLDDQRLYTLSTKQHRELSTEVQI